MSKADGGNLWRTNARDEQGRFVAKVMIGVVSAGVFPETPYGGAVTLTIERPDRDSQWEMQLTPEDAETMADAFRACAQSIRKTQSR